MIHYAHRRRRRRRPDQKEGGRHVKKTVPIGLLDQSEWFEMIKLLAIWFIANFDRISIDSRVIEKIAKNWISNHCIPIGVLIHKNSLVSKESYRKVFDRTEFFFDLYGQIWTDL